MTRKFFLSMTPQDFKPPYDGRYRDGYLHGLRDMTRHLAIHKNGGQFVGVLERPLLVFLKELDEYFGVEPLP